MTDPLIPQKLHKPRPAIDISNEITKLQRQAFNLMLAFARPTIEQNIFHEIPTAELARELKASNNYDLKRKIESMQKILVRWDIFEKGSLFHCSAQLLGEVRFNDSLTRFWFSPGIREIIINSKRYATLNLAIQKNFLSKHSQCLWEFCHEFIDTQSGSTGWKSIDEWRNLFGIDDNKYKQFKEFNKFVINLAVKELNEVSDIRIKAEYKRSGRSISEIRFLAKWKTKDDVKQINDAPKKIKIPEFEKWFLEQPKSWKDLFDANFEKSCDEVDEPTRAEIYREAKRREYAKANAQSMFDKTD